MSNPVATPEPLLDVSALTKQFQGLKAVDGVDLAVRPGTVHGLIGPNGAGKTTLFNMISGSLPPSGGELRFEGQRIDHRRQDQRTALGIARTFQIPRPFPGMSVLDNLRHAVEHFQVSVRMDVRRENAEGAAEVMANAGFEVSVHGELHAVIHPDIPRIPNIGFLVGGQVFHPGDAFTVPEEPVATLLLPVHAPWSKLSEVIDYVREVRADQAYALHDALLSELGLGAFARLLGEGGPGTPTPYSRLAPGDSVEL